MKSTKPSTPAWNVPSPSSFWHGRLATDHAALCRFHQEARAASALNHPRICTIHDIGDYQGRPFLMLELLEGESLRDRIAGKPVPMADLSEAATQIAEGLRAAHAKGIVHRDIKPANISSPPENRSKTLDFGLAKLGGGETTAAVTPSRSASKH